MLYLGFCVLLEGKTHETATNGFIYIVVLEQKWFWGGKYPCLPCFFDWQGERGTYILASMNNEKVIFLYFFFEIPNMFFYSSQYQVLRSYYFAPLSQKNVKFDQLFQGLTDDLRTCDNSCSLFRGWPVHGYIWILQRQYITTSKTSLTLLTFSGAK